MNDHDLIPPGMEVFYRTLAENVAYEWFHDGGEAYGEGWYHYLGYGLLLSFGGGKTVFLQGEEAEDLYDQLESCEDVTQIIEMIAAYEEYAETDE